MGFFFITDLPAEIACLVVLACWIGFGFILLIGKSRASDAEVKRDTKSRLGFFLQCAGYVIAIAFPRTFFSPIAPMSETGERVLALMTIVIALASVGFCFAAAWALGKQWALVARLVESHELIRTGPYAIVRNPIYLAMLGMMVATGLAVSRWQALVGGTVVFLIGNSIRIHTEEKLLRGAFGASFDEYARRVPALLPRIF